jgi:hypothetical protein
VKQALAYLRLYTRAAWPITLAFTGVLAALVVYQPALPLDLIRSTPATWLAIISLAYALALLVRLSPCDDYIISTGASPRRRLAALILAFTLHLGFTWLIMSLCVWLRLRSTFQESAGNIYYPETASVDDSTPFFWLTPLPVIILLFVEFRLRLAGRHNPFASLLFVFLCVLAAFSVAEAFNWLRYDFSLRPGALLIASTAILLSRLLNILFLINNPSLTTHWNTLRPTAVRASDAALILIGSLILAVGSFLETTYTASSAYYIPNDTYWPLVVASHALVAIIFLLGAFFSFKSHAAATALALVFALMLLIIPCQLASRSYLGSHTRTARTIPGELLFFTPLPNAQIIIDGVPHSPQPARKRPNTWEVRIDPSSLPDPSPALTTPYIENRNRPDMLLNQTLEAQTTRHVMVSSGSVIRKIQVKIGPDIAYIYDRYVLIPDEQSGNDIHVNLRPTPWEYNRRYQPLIAWMILHPQETDIAPLFEKLRTPTAAYALILRLNHQYPTHFLPLLQAYTLNGAKPITFTPDDNWRIVQAVFKDQVTSLNKPIYDQAISRLSPTQVADLLASQARRRRYPGYPFTQERFRPDLLQSLFEQWLQAHAEDPDALARLREAITPTLIASHQLQNLARLGGPTADRFFRKAIDEPSAQTIIRSPDPNKNALAAHPLILGASMPAPEGDQFYADFAPRILQVLIALRKKSRPMEIDRQTVPWFRNALGPLTADGKPTPIRQAYWDWYTAQFLKPDASPDIRIQFQFLELFKNLQETRVEPYLKVLEDPRTHMPEPTPPDGETPTGHQWDIWDRYTRTLSLGLPVITDDDAARNQIFTHIMDHVIKDPRRYGVPTSQPPNADALKRISQITNPVPANQADPESNKRIEKYWILGLLENPKFSQEQKRNDLALAIQNGHVNASAASVLAAQTTPWVRPFAIDVILRWPTPENLTLLTTLASDPDPAVASTAKAAQSFITHLQTLPVEKIPDPFTPESIRFFDLPSPQK